MRAFRDCAASILFGLGLLAPFLDVSHAQSGPSDWKISPFNPPALPLGVRSPALNTWVAQGNNPASIANIWANSLLQSPGHVTGWYASVVVDGVAYRVIGQAAITNTTAANLTSIIWTATQTSFLLTAGPMTINATFISPIEPTDMVRQSMPFSYLTMSATSNDGNQHTVRMYSDISGEFIAGNTNAIAQWNSTDDGQYIVLSMALQNPLAFTEILGRPSDATEYYAYKRISGTTTTWQITQDTTARGSAANISATLSNEQDPTPRAVGDDWPVMGIEVDWGSIKSTSEPAVWAIGLWRSPSIQYRTSQGSIVPRYPYYQSVYGDGIAASKAFLDDYSRAASAAQAFDTSLAGNASAVSSDYADVVALSARQLFGGLDITIARDGSGNWNASDLMVFMKNFGTYGSDSGGASESINTVDTIYAAFPALLYLNPELVGGLLRPLLEYMDSSAYSLNYAAKNIGSAYPNATADGINTGHDYGLEESANMIIMTLAYSQRSGNGTLISKHYTLLREWAQYLMNNTLTPSNQRTADYSSSSNASPNNQTNLAIKGIIGLGAMAKIADKAGVSSDQSTFNDTASSYMSQWETNAVASDNSHIDFYYSDSSSNGLIYNLYADKLLQLNMVPDAVYQVATVFYNNIAGSDTYGLALDSDDGQRSSISAMMFSAATVTNSATRDYMISQVRNYASSDQNNTQFPTVFNPQSGEPVNPSAGINNPSIGGIFSFLALNTTVKDFSIPSLGSTIPGLSDGSSSNKGAIAGGVVGGLAGLALIGGGLFWYLRRRRHQQEQVMYDARADPILEISTSAGSKPSGWNATTFTHEPFMYNNGYASPGVSVPQMSPEPNQREFPYGVPVAAGATAGYVGPTNVRDSTYFRTHRTGESEDIGPSVSQVGSTSISGSGSRGRGRGNSTSSHGGSGSAASQALLAKQAMVNDELRSEVDNLRRDLERIREERAAASGPGSGSSAFGDHDLPPPQYSDSA